MAKRRKLSITTKKQTSSLSHPAESELELDVPPRSGPVIARRGRDTFEANRVFQPSNDGIPPLGFSSYGVSAKQCFSGDKSVVSGLPEERTRDSSDSEGGSEDAVRELLGEVCDIFASASPDVQRYHASLAVLLSWTTTQLAT